MIRVWQVALGVSLFLCTSPQSSSAKTLNTLRDLQQQYQSFHIAATPNSSIARTAKAVTVMIEDDFANGSGIIIQKQGNRYTILTAAHVVESPYATYQVTTSDQQKHPVQASEVKRLPNVDMATITFESNRTYPVAKLASAQLLSEGTSVYVTGFPSPTAAISTPVYNFTDGQMTARSSQGFRDGYAMVYTNRTLPGMSGGGVFDPNGNLVGIHGRGDVDSSLESSNINSDIRIKTGFNLGIPVDTFVSRSSEMGIILKINLPEPAPSNPVDDLVVSATVKAQQNDYNGAIADLSRAIQRSPQEARLYLARAGYYSLTGRNDAAVSDLSQAIKYDPTQEQAYWLRGSYRQANRDPFGALDDFNQVIRINPENSRAYLMRATIHVAQTDYESAIADYSQMIRIDPKNALAYSQRGSMKFIQGNAQGAIADYTKLIAINPKDVDAFDRRAHVRRYNGDPSGAISDYKAITNINPRSIRAWSAIADISTDQNKFDRAIDAYGEIIAINPKDANIALRVNVRMIFKCGINAVSKGFKLIPTFPHFVLDRKPPMLNFIEIRRIGRQI